jgi:NAD dependent epimerase/dehydratase
MSAWNGKKVLVTGADGFIGSHLCEALVREGADVTAFTYYNSLGSRGWIDLDTPDDLRARMKCVDGDIRDAERVRRAIEGQHTVFHLASLIAIPYSYHAPQSYVETNVTGTLNVMSACREHGVQKIVHTSTSEVYGTALRVPIDETHPLQGQSPYSATKIGADMIAESFHRSFSLPVAIARPFNTYGPRQSARAIIPTILVQLLSGSKEIRLGALHPTRDLNFVSDTVEGFLAIGAHPKTVGQTLNIGSGKEISIGDLAKMLIQVSGRDARVVQEKERMRPEKSEVERLLCDPTRLNALTGWKSKLGLEEGLRATAEWLSKRLDLYKPGSYQL